jgi:hypothetical protein
VLARRPWLARAAAGPQWLRHRAAPWWRGRAWPWCRRRAAHPLTWPGLAGVALGLLAIGPALAPGYVLSYDMVFLPHAPLSAAAIGLSGGPPRAVPSDAVIAALSAVIPADLLQKVILVAIFAASCAGAAWLLGRCAERAGRAAPLLARLAAGVFYAWNPFVAERLIIGHWALLLGYAALPWVVAAAWTAGPTWPRWAGRLAATLIPAAIGGYAAVGISALAAVPAALARRSGSPGTGAGPGTGVARGRRLAVTAGLLVAASLPWLIPSLLIAVHTDPAGADAFAARPDTPFGGAVSLLMLGGSWNAQVVPRGYGGPGSAAWLLVVLAALAGYLVLGARKRAAPGLGVGAVAGLAAGAIGLTGPSRAVLRHLIAAWPGFGVLRDGQQFIAPLALAEAIGLGLGVAWLLTAMARTLQPAPGPPGCDGARTAATALAVMAVLAPVLLLPGLAWGAAGRLHATAYPADWLATRRLVDADPRPGSVALLPWAAYRHLAWNDGEAGLDPWTKLLRRPVIWNDALQVGALTVAAEDAPARRLTPAMTGTGPLTGPLRAAGVRYVIVDAGPLLAATAEAGRGTGCLAARARLPGASVVLASRDLIVFRLPGPVLASAANPVKGTTCPPIGG